MSTKIRRLKIAAAAVVAVSLAIVLTAPSPVTPATVCKANSGSTPLTIQDFSGIPQPVIDDATEVAAGLFNTEAKRHDFMSQILATYLEARDNDIVVFYNPGGWGWDPIEESPNMGTIIDGIQAELTRLGYSSLVLEYKRTAHSLNGCISELMLAAAQFPMKIEDLAARIEFLTGHIPDIRVILIGESNGAAFCENVMNSLQQDSRVYAIQIGPPFWHNGSVSDRALVLRSNGSVPDTFSHGDVITIIRSNLEALFGISQQNPGNILLYIGAPGHDYSWQYPEVRLKITGFLDNSFSRR
jgi:pimeloyl-ACP methyl ester carboxylesterase